MPHGLSTVTEWDSRGLAIWAHSICGGEWYERLCVLGMLGKTASQSTPNMQIIVQDIFALCESGFWAYRTSWSDACHCWDAVTEDTISGIFTLLHPSHARKIQMPFDEQTNVRGNWSSMQRTMLSQAFKWLKCQPTRNCYRTSDRARPQNSTIQGFLASENCLMTNSHSCRPFILVLNC